jgi:L-glyceraldehyde 3-phosphate reductase
VTSFAENRYSRLPYRRTGSSGLQLPAVSLGLWHNFGDDVAFDLVRSLCRRAFDCGVTHFDVANNYGPPGGASEANFGRILYSDFSAHRDELIISTKAGYRMWPGPYGEFGSRKYMIASLDRSLRRLGLDYVDIFYSHRFDPKTPLEETMGALDSIVRQGKALYVGISSYGSARTREAAAILRRMGTPLLVHQPSYSMFNRWTETDRLLDALESEGVGCIAFSPLAQGLLSDKYLSSIPQGSRAAAGKSLPIEHISGDLTSRLRALDAIARRRGQSLAQMAIARVLRDPRMTSALIGVSRPEQLDDCIEAAAGAPFDATELSEIDQYAVDRNLNLWSESSTG